MTSTNFTFAQLMWSHVSDTALKGIVLAFADVAMSRFKGIAVVNAAS